MNLCLTQAAQALKPEMLAVIEQEATMTMVSAAKAGKEIDTLLYQVQQGREVVIIGAGGAAFKLIALPRMPQPVFGSAQGQVEIGANFDAPIPGFEEYSP